MRCRLLRRSLLFTLLGLVTSVAVAWGVAIFYSLQRWDPVLVRAGIAAPNGIVSRVDIYRRAGARWEVWNFADTSVAGAYTESLRSFAEELEQVGGEAFVGDQGTSDPEVPPDALAARGPPSGFGAIGREGSYVERSSAGWPLHSLDGSRRIDYDRRSPLRTAAQSQSCLLRISSPFKPAGSRAEYSGDILLPLRPRPGLLLNTLFYALLWTLLLLAPGALRRRIRRARARCPTCGYSLRGQPAPGCPECGAGRQPPPPAPLPPTP